MPGGARQRLPVLGKTWKRLESTIEYVLGHPNGWEGGQQDLMRKAAILAGFIPNTEAGRSDLFFVTEGEASLHFLKRV